MHARHFASIACLTLVFAAAHAERDPGWEFGGEAIYQTSKDINFKGGSSASLDDDLGLSLVFAYRFNSRFDLQFSLDWNTVDYDITVGSDAGFGFTGRGDLEAFTPRVGVNFNILEGNLTPYVGAGVGWSFVDTNIPNGPPQTSCWWDPWWGYYCGTFQSTRSTDQLTYNAAAGVRWDVSDTITLKLGYNRNWVDLSEASGTPGFDQVRFGVYGRY